MQMHRQSLPAYAAPLCETVVEAPQPQGSEVLVRILEYSAAQYMAGKMTLEKEQPAIMNQVKNWKERK